jgi:U3 small nucleolar RNA-associated protein 10
MPTFVAQVEVCPSFKLEEARQALKTCLSALVAAVDDDSLLKKLNLELLMQTRSDDAQVRLFALECAEHIWHRHGEKLSGFVSDVVTFIAECADDEHDEVAKVARGLKRTVESRCGSLDVLMQ